MRRPEAFRALRSRDFRAGDHGAIIPDTLEVLHRKGQTIMNATRGRVVPAGDGKHLDMGAPGRFAALKLLGRETNESIMLFEETVPVGTKSLFHLHRDSDEVAWVLAGEITFKIGDEVSVGGPGTCAFFPRDVPHAWKSTGRETGRVLFLYTPAAAGGYVEALLERPAGPMDDDERNTLRERYRWEVLGPNPL
jgi:quercetin dioxygenase-like cupin family protein